MWDQAMEKFGTAHINFERKEFSPFRRVDTVCHAAALTGKSTLPDSRPRDFLSSGPFQIVNIQGKEPS